MHAYIILTRRGDDFLDVLGNYIDHRTYQKYEYPMQKIDDARKLNKFLQFSFTKKTLIVLAGFQNATDECVNAVLKTLEEPQEYVTFAIPASNINLILPTIVSRCQVVNSVSKKNEGTSSAVKEFTKMDLVKKSDFLKNIKQRSDMISFCDELLLFYETKLKNPKIAVEYKSLVKNTLDFKHAIEANGNINLHALKFLSNISD